MTIFGTFVLHQLVIMNAMISWEANLINIMKIPIIGKIEWSV